jgi:hypothetical protein
MAQYTERVQTVLTKTQYEYLLKLADEEHKPVSKLIREAIEAFYFVQIEKERRRQALSNLLALDAPVVDWPEMEAEIERGVMDE